MGLISSKIIVGCLVARGIMGKKHFHFWTNLGLGRSRIDVLKISVTEIWSTRHHAALEGPPGDTLTVSYAVQYWLDKVTIAIRLIVWDLVSIIALLSL